MKNQIAINARVNKSGELVIYGEDYMNDFLSKNKNKSAIVLIIVNENKSSPSFIGYYRNKILPDLQKAYAEKGDLRTIKSIDEELRVECPATIKEIYNEEKKAYEKELIDLNDLEEWQLVVFIDYYIRPWAAKNLNVFVDSTITL